MILTGPRQSGKTTLLRRLFGGTHRYVSLDPLDVRASAGSDPRGFLDSHPAPVIFDEVQNAPALLPYIKERIDERRAIPGQYLLTGSQNLLLLQGTAETLAGRAAVLHLLPFSRRELSGRNADPLPWEGRAESPAPPPASLWQEFVRGGYPELATSPDRDIYLWHASYTQTYLERDIRSLRQIGDLSSFQSFLRALAARSGQLLNLSEIARDLGIAVNTVKAWISILEAGFQILVLRPYFANVGKRLVKTPKVYFADTGTLCHLVGLRDPGHAQSSPMAGTIFETVVLMEIVKTLAARGEQPQVHFWRTARGSEVDIVVETGGRLIPIEVKLSATPRPAMAEGIQEFRTALEERAGEGYLMHPGSMQLPLIPGVIALPLGGL